MHLNEKYYKRENILSKVSNFITNIFKLITSLRYKSMTWVSLAAVQENCIIDKFTKIYPPCCLSNIEVGYGSYISQNSNISNTIIGKFCSIGPNLVCGWGIHPLDSLSTSPMFYSTLRQNGMTLTKDNKIVERKPIMIENDVFIGANVTVLDGVKIGNGAVIAAGAVVSNNIAPYAIAGGVPAKVIKYRFESDKIEKLLTIKWWDWDIEELPKVEQYFSNVDEFIDKHYNAHR